MKKSVYIATCISYMRKNVGQSPHQKQESELNMYCIVAMHTCLQSSDYATETV